MARPSTPYYKASKDRWVCTINGKRYTLGKSRKEAYQRFHELMASSEPLPKDSFTTYELSQAYLEWVENNRKPTTFTKNLHFIQRFIQHVGKRIKPSEVKPSVVLKWASESGLNSTSQATAIGCVQRMFNWAVEHSHLTANPIATLKKPKQRRRDVVYTPEQYREIRSFAKGPLGDLLDFMSLTGCRPQEARILEARHVHDDVVIFPADEAKGETSRVLFLTNEALEIVKRLTKKNPTGAIFRNSRGIPWTKESVRCRLTRIGAKVGYRVVAYGFRHTFATQALLKGVDPISVAHLMGHKNTNMVASHYSHLAANPEFLKQQAKRATK